MLDKYKRRHVSFIIMQKSSLLLLLWAQFLLAKKLLFSKVEILKTATCGNLTLSDCENASKMLELSFLIFFSLHLFPLSPPPF